MEDTEVQKMPLVEHDVFPMVEFGLKNEMFGGLDIMEPFPIMLFFIFGF